MGQRIFYKNIAISGDVGSGKSTLAKNLSEVLNWKYISAGEIFREWHRNHNVPVHNTLKIPSDFDRKIDADFKEHLKSQKNVVFESHLAGWLAKDLDQTYKILVTADFDERMKRIALREHTSVKRITETSRRRAELLANKFKDLYQVNNSFDKKYFNLIIDSTGKSTMEVLEIVLKTLIGKSF